MPQVPPWVCITKTGLGRPWPVAKEEFKTPPRRATVLSGLENSTGIPVWCVGTEDSCSIDYGVYYFASNQPQLKVLQPGLISEATGSARTSDSWEI